MAKSKGILLTMKNKLYNNDELCLKLELHIRNKNYQCIEYNENKLKLFIELCVNKYFNDKELVKITNY